MILVFAASVFVAGRVAKRLQIEDASYGRALWATILKNVGSLVVVALLDRYLDAPVAATLILAGVVLPIIVYQRVFEAAWTEALQLWFVVLLVEIVLIVGLTFASLAFGTWLEERFNIPKTLP